MAGEGNGKRHEGGNDRQYGRAFLTARCARLTDQWAQQLRRYHAAPATVALADAFEYQRQDKGDKK